MSYCRFQNTVSDLRDCKRNIHNVDDLSKEESSARADLIGLCAEILESVGYEVNEPDDDDEPDCILNEERVFGYTEKRELIGNDPNEL